MIKKALNNEKIERKSQQINIVLKQNLIKPSSFIRKWDHLGCIVNQKESKWDHPGCIVNQKESKWDHQGCIVNQKESI